MLSFQTDEKPNLRLVRLPLNQSNQVAFVEFLLGEAS